MSFVALPPTPASPAASKVPGDDWYPDIDCNAFRNALRMGETVTHDRLVGAIEGAQLTVEGELAEWRAAREAEGAATLAEVDAGKSVRAKYPERVLLGFAPEDLDLIADTVLTLLE